MEELELLRHLLPTEGRCKNTYVALSGKHGLRWILPTKSRKLSGLLASWRPYSIPARAAWGVICFAARGNFLQYLPVAKNFDLDLSAVNWRDYCWTLKEPPTVIAYVGTPGAHRKLIVTLADPHNGAGRLVIKFPLNDTAWPKINREYNVLKELSNECHVAAPLPVKIESKKRYSVQKYLAGRPVGASLTDAHYHFLASL